jgi:hypothetical protein
MNLSLEFAPFLAAACSIVAVLQLAALRFC